MKRIIPDHEATRLSLTAPADLRRAPGPLPEEELSIARRARTNTLLIGPSRAIAAAIEVLIADRRDDVSFWTPDHPIRIPERTVVVIRDVGVLAPNLQAAWLAALDRSAREDAPHVIATNSFSVFPLVERGLFLDALYYRLNCMLVDLRRGRLASSAGASSRHRAARD